MRIDTLGVVPRGWVYGRLDSIDGSFFHLERSDTTLAVPRNLIAAMEMNEGTVGRVLRRGFLDQGLGLLGGLAGALIAGAVSDCELSSCGMTIITLGGVLGTGIAFVRAVQLYVRWTTVDFESASQRLGGVFAIRFE